ncbi:T9SS C-terminal target domain-containing protein [Paraflavitalea soli]|uniref:T9SS C-terminal target domain-containing protein n=1 Tax=Paraflavitalea soli TaxID=2315862 RepID=A0A3B7MSN8_9BACT|nr:T9SS type A sorting domain-containing protein [Paraflavitalea soli]AXY77522.1 T9SS C-terminal target domain-containing protein [Paraflavitalea soli]
MKKLLLCLSVLVTLSVSAQHVPKSLTAANGQFIGFYQYTPTNYNANPNTKYPLIIFLHGIGERGNGTTELSNILGLGVPGAINSGSTMTFTWNGKTETFLVLSPQLDRKYGGWQNFYVEEMINYAKKNLRIDENRIFLTGLSLGGGGVWSYAGASLDNAKKLAAIGVCCGTCQNVNYANLTNANLPVWAFHAQDDGTVGVGCTTGAITAINNQNPVVKPYMTIWPTGQHWIWGRVYDTEYNWQNPNLYEWFLGQNKSLAPNKRPVADAGNPLSILSTLGIVTLSGAKSTDADGKIVRYIWTKISGPNAGVISAAVSIGSSTTVTGLNLPGTYQYELKVVDDRADWTTDTVTVTVGLGTPPPTSNKPPVVNAGADVTISLPTYTAALTGTATDADGYIVSYNWTKVSGPSSFEIINPNYASTTVTGLVAGTYVFRLTAIDDKNAIVSDDKTITVNASGPGVGDGVNAGADVTITLPTNSVSLDGSASVDPYGGSIYAWKWEKISGPAQFSITNTAVATTTATNLAAGTYEFRLTTWNSQWVPKSDTKIVTVKSATTDPPPAQTGRIANAGADFSITLPTTTATLNGSASSNPNGPINAYTWTKISGPAATIANAKVAVTTVSGLTEGTYQFKLTVWDHQFVPSSDTVQLIVKPGASKPEPVRIANAGADVTITLPTNSATLNGSASANPNGTISSYGWTKISGPAATIANNKAATTAVSGLTAGTYLFQLTVWDNLFVPSSDTMQLVVNPATGTPPPTGRNKIANAGADVTITLPTSSVTLDGSGTYNAYGPVNAYTWTKISGPAATITNAKAAVTTATGLTAGTYQFRLTAWDHEFVPSSDTMQVIVKAATSSGSNSTASGNGTITNAGPDQTLTLPTNTTTLNGSASYDPEGVFRAWKWMKISGPDQHTITNASNQVTTVSNLVEGTYRFSLTGWGNNWRPFSDTMQITVVSSSSLTTTTTRTATTTSDVTDTKTGVIITEDKLLVYPNPAQEQINVQTTSTTTGAAFLNIYDMSGKLIQKTGFQKMQSLHQQVLNISSLKAGVYQAEVVIDNVTRLHSKFVKQ